MQTPQILQDQIQQNVARIVNFIVTRDSNCFSNVLKAAALGAVFGGTRGAGVGLGL